MKTLLAVLLASAASASAAYAADSGFPADIAQSASATQASANPQVPADPVKAAAQAKCAQVAGKPETGCLIDERATAGSTPGVIDKTRDVAASAAEKTREVAATAAEKTREAASTAAEKTREVAATAADKARDVTDTVVDKSRDVADTVGGKTGGATSKGSEVVSDAVITTKVKADIFKEPELKSLAIHVETDNGTVLLSGFVNSKADADRAVEVARGVSGVSAVKSAIKVR